MAIARRAAEAGVVLTALIVAIGAGWWLTSRARDDDGQAAPLPTPLPHSFRYFSPVPTTAPTRVGLSRRFTPAGLEGGLPHEVLAALPDPNTTDPRYAITALDAVTDSVGGPRLALAGGATNGTIDLGEVVAGQPVTVPLGLATAGDAPRHVAQLPPPSTPVAGGMPAQQMSQERCRRRRRSRRAQAAGHSDQRGNRGVTSCPKRSHSSRVGYPAKMKESIPISQ